jgi:hypothetical protein
LGDPSKVRVNDAGSALVDGMDEWGPMGRLEKMPLGKGGSEWMGITYVQFYLSGFGLIMRLFRQYQTEIKTLIRMLSY